MSETQNQIEAFFTGTVLEDGYGYIPRSIMRDKTLHRNSRAIYAYFMSFAGSNMTAFPSVKTICSELGFGNEGTYYKYLNELKDRGLLSSKLIKSDKGKFDKNMFTITLHKSQIEIVKQYNAKISKERMEQRGKNPYCKNRSMEPNFTFRSTENPSTENSSTNINNTNINSTNILEEKETLNNKVVQTYHDCISSDITIYENKQLYELQKKFGIDFLTKAIVLATIKNAKNLGYIITILNDWYSKRIETIDELNIYLESWVLKNKKAKENREKNITRQAENTKTARTNFADYEQRNYDYDKLEKGLLGLDI